MQLHEDSRAALHGERGLMDDNTPVVLVTGALTGIGRATARAFAREGARLVVSGRRDEEGAALAADLRSLGAEAEFVHADVRREDDVRKLVDKTVERFGRLDVAVNNAGTEGKRGPITEQSADTYASIFETNVLGVLLSLKHELRVMMPQHHGSIINLSSVFAHMPAPDSAVYSASKHAVDGLTEAAAFEAANSGVRVNGVAPGPIATAMMDRSFESMKTQEKDAFMDKVALRRPGTVEEVAQTVLFLASDRASYVTGTTLAVDGGMAA
jgi:NAD(P)-dependent dehydrogenase (short-subunit alcohol dehydrogenase family)